MVTLSSVRSMKLRTDATGSDWSVRSSKVTG
jgi:hypothetical protein